MNNYSFVMVKPDTYHLIVKNEKDEYVEILERKDVNGEYLAKICLFALTRFKKDFNDSNIDRFLFT